MPLSQMGNFTFNHSDQVDELYTTKTSAQIKAAFDSRASEVKTALNDAIAILLATTTGASGAHNVGSASITGVTGATVYDQLANLKTLLDGVVLGQIPDGSLTTAKYANGSVTAAKVAADVATQAELDVVSASLTTHTAYTPNHVGSIIYSYNNLGGAL